MFTGVSRWWFHVQTTMGTLVTQIPQFSRSGNGAEIDPFGLGAWFARFT
jgi:hypothetical protein